MACIGWDGDIFQEKILLRNCRNNTWNFETVEAHIVITNCPFCGYILDENGCTKIEEE